MSPRTFELFAVPGGGTLRFAGELDAASAPEVHRALSELVGQAGTDVELDLARLTFIDSVGLGALLKAAQQLDRQGRRLVVRHAHEAVRRTIELTGLDAVLHLEG